MIRDELGDKVAANAVLGGFARFEFEGIGDEVEVFGEGVRAKGDFDELDEAADDVIVEVGLVGDGEDGVLVWGKAKVGRWGGVVSGQLGEELLVASCQLRGKLPVASCQLSVESLAGNCLLSTDYC